MTTMASISLRLTHKYRSGWKETDKWSESLGIVKLTHPAHHREDECGESGSWAEYCRVPSHMPLKAAMLAMRDTFSGSSCQHEHDCCGCKSYSATVTRVRGRQVRVLTHWSRNL